MADHEERNEQPTAARRAEARSQGRVATSRDFTAALSLLAAVLVLPLLGTRIAGGFERVLSRSTAPVTAREVLTVTSVSERILEAGAVGWTGILPFVATLVSAAVIACVLQTGGLVRPSRVVPDLTRLSPAVGLARALEPGGWTRGVLHLVKCLWLFAVLVAAVAALAARGSALPGPPGESLRGAVATALRDVLTAASVALAGLAVAGAADWGLARWRLERELRMTRREVDEELARQEPPRRIREGRRKLGARMASARKPRGRREGP